MDLMLSLSQHCGLKGGLAQQTAAAGWVWVEKWGGGQSSTDLPKRAQT